MISRGLRSAGRLRALHAPSLIDDDTSLPDVLWRHRGGTYSSTVGRLQLDDGTTARTDLIRLSPNVDAYSLDPHGQSPRRLVPYRVRPWAEAPTSILRRQEAAIVWLLANSYPTIDTATLSAQLRASGHAIGAGDISLHDAIAATQAALWTVTSGLRPHRGAAGPIAELSRAAASRLLRVGPGAPAVLPVELPAEAVVRGYRVDLRDADLFGGDLHDIQVHLEQSENGERWLPVPSSRVLATEGRQHADTCLLLRKGIGVGATVASVRGGRQVGYAHYRIVVSSRRTTAVRIEGIDLDLADSPLHGNSPAVLALYDHLCAGAAAAAHAEGVIRGPRTALAGPSSLIGPYHLDPGAIQFALVSADDPRIAVVDADGRAVDAVAGGEAFWLDVGAAAAADTASLVIDVVAGWHRSGRVLLSGSEADGTACTPLALAVQRRASLSRIAAPITYRSARLPAPARLAAL
ncbi:thioester domain-containing protein [Microbacterium sp.]|uniref:thioester domain-containing protein n=1 Tax=Microbacterium sp. TaxID=51671 RepID=UPI003C71BB0F